MYRHAGAPKDARRDSQHFAAINTVPFTCNFNVVAKLWHFAELVSREQGAGQLQAALNYLHKVSQNNLQGNFRPR